MHPFFTQRNVKEFQATFNPITLYIFTSYCLSNILCSNFFSVQKFRYQISLVSFILKTVFKIFLVFYYIEIFEVCRPVFS